MRESIFQSNGITNQMLLNYMESLGEFDEESNIVYQAGDGGPVVGFDIAAEYDIDDDWYGKDTIVLYSSDDDYYPKSPRLTLEDFKKILEANKSKQVVLPGNGFPVKEIGICKNYRELKKFIQSREFEDNMAKSIRKSKLHYPVLVLDDCI
ncbi:MAG: hypothetical protein IKK93_06915 [Campylobacter sp.]|nr:hypothetical protein [Campylobacter sp.]